MFGQVHHSTSQSTSLSTQNYCKVWSWLHSSSTQTSVHSRYLTHWVRYISCIRTEHAILLNTTLGAWFTILHRCSRLSSQTHTIIATFSVRVSTKSWIPDLTHSLTLLTCIPRSCSTFFLIRSKLKLSPLTFKATQIVEVTQIFTESSLSCLGSCSISNHQMLHQEITAL